MFSIPSMTKTTFSFHSHEFIFVMVCSLYMYKKMFSIPYMTKTIFFVFHSHVFIFAMIVICIYKCIYLIFEYIFVLYLHRWGAMSSSLQINILFCSVLFCSDSPDVLANDNSIDWIICVNIWMNTFELFSCNDRHHFQNKKNVNNKTTRMRNCYLQSVKLVFIFKLVKIFTDISWSKVIFFTNLQFIYI